MDSPLPDDAKRLGHLVYLLQALHVLFGITAVIGMLVNHTKHEQVRGTLAESHFNWQKISFWVLAPAYVAGFLHWIGSGSITLLMIVAAVALYRIAWGWWQLRNRQTIGFLW